VFKNEPPFSCSVTGANAGELNGEIVKAEEQEKQK
jgi:hypothetical protein